MAPTLGWKPLFKLLSYDLEELLLPEAKKRGNKSPVQRDVVRLMAHVETDQNRDQIQHVYLRGAAALRQDIAQ